MLISLLILLLLSNALTLRKDKSILFSRLVVLGLTSTSFLAWNNLFFKPLEKGIGIYGGLFNITTFTQTFNIFIYIISAIILLLTAFYPRKVSVKEHSSPYSLLFSKFTYNKNTISNKMGGQFRIIEYPLSIVFILCGASLLTLLPVKVLFASLFRILIKKGFMTVFSYFSKKTIFASIIFILIKLIYLCPDIFAIWDMSPTYIIQPGELSIRLDNAISRMAPRVTTLQNKHVEFEKYYDRTMHYKANGDLEGAQMNAAYAEAYRHDLQIQLWYYGQELHVYNSTYSLNPQLTLSERSRESIGNPGTIEHSTIVMLARHFADPAQKPIIIR